MDSISYLSPEDLSIKKIIICDRKIPGYILMTKQREIPLLDEESPRGWCLFKRTGEVEGVRWPARFASASPKGSTVGTFVSPLFPADFQQFLSGLLLFPFHIIDGQVDHFFSDLQDFPVAVSQFFHRFFDVLHDPDRSHLLTSPSFFRNRYLHYTGRSGFFLHENRNPRE